MIIIICGKSGSGKDTIIQAMLNDSELNLKPIITTTSRPKRPSEKEGKEYHFITKEQFLADISANKFLEYRKYNTLVNNIPETWYYGSPFINADIGNFITILDIQGAGEYINHYGRNKCFTIMIDVADKLRESRVSARSGFDKSEWSRRLADDNIKFSNTAVQGIVDVAVDNQGDITETISHIKAIIQKQLSLSKNKGIVI